VDVLETYVALLSRAGRDAVPALARGLRLEPSAAAAAYAATAALVLGGLARHQARRGTPDAAAAIVEKFGRPADVDAPALAVAGHLARADLDPRLGGLLGDDAARLTAWLAARTGAPAATMGRAVAACAPLALGALRAATPAENLPAFLAGIGTAALDAPASLAAGEGPSAAVFDRVRRGARSFWQRLRAR